MRPEDIKEFRLEVTQNICRKVYPVIKPGDIINVHFTKKPRKGDYVLISYNEKQWIDQFQGDKADFNCYLITHVVMNS
jgi:hypothetical protein